MGVAVKMAKMTWQVGLAIFPASGYSSQRPNIKMDRIIGHRDLGPWLGHFLRVGDVPSFRASSQAPAAIRSLTTAPCPRCEARSKAWERSLWGPVKGPNKEDIGPYRGYSRPYILMQSEGIPTLLGSFTGSFEEASVGIQGHIRALCQIGSLDVVQWSYCGPQE